MNFETYFFSFSSFFSFFNVFKTILILFFFLDGVHCLHPAPSSQTGMHEVGTTRCTKFFSLFFSFLNVFKTNLILFFPLDSLHRLHPAPSNQSGLYEVGDARFPKRNANWCWGNEERKKIIFSYQSGSLVGLFDIHNGRHNHGTGAPSRKPPMIFSHTHTRTTKLIMMLSKRRKKRKHSL